MAEYVPGRAGGAECPRCGAFSGVYKTMPRTESEVIRYHRCPGCGFGFKSVERLGIGNGELRMEN